MTEVGGDGAFYIDPENAKGAAATIVENLWNAGLMREAGFSNVRKFSAEEMVFGYINAYDCGKEPGALRFLRKSKSVAEGEGRPALFRRDSFVRPSAIIEYVSCDWRTS